MRQDYFHHGWLPLILPSAPRRYRIADAALASALASAGAEVVDQAPDVEIASAPADIRGEAPLAVVTVNPSPRHGGARPVEAFRRVTESLRARLRARAARRRLRRLGYTETSILLWDVRHRVELPGISRTKTSLKERVPGRALALGRRGSREPSALEAALAAAAREAGIDLRPHWASIQVGVVVVASDSAVLRVAIGHSRVQIQRQVAVLQRLGELDLPAVVADRVPWPLANGRVGLADWSLERLLPGTRPPRTLTPGLFEECVEFLAQLHRAGNGQAEGVNYAELAGKVAGVCAPETEAVVKALGERLESELADVPRGFVHGDVFAGNMLAEGDRLLGVLDWDGGGPGRLPMVDLLHLQLTQEKYGSDDDWGRALIERLLSSAREGGNEALRRYCSQIGIEPDPPLLEACVLAYWIEYVANQLQTHLDRRFQPAWLEGNVELVAREVERVTKRTPAASVRPGGTHGR